jgi:hypothetical protein
MKTVRLFAIWLLMFALPMQGIAASTMIACGPNHHAQLAHSASTSPSATHDHQKPNHAWQARGEHRTHSAHIEVGDFAGTVPSDAKGKCSVCASCCNGSLIVARADATRLIEFSSPEYLSEAVSFDDAPRHSLKRPPRG